jgi:hypothetical protein
VAQARAQQACKIDWVHRAIDAAERPLTQAAVAAFRREGSPLSLLQNKSLERL